MHDKILLLTAALLPGSRNRSLCGCCRAFQDQTHTGCRYHPARGALHVWAESHHWVIPTSPHVSLLNILSLCALVTVAIPLATFPMRNSLFDASLVALPLSVLIFIAEGTITAPALEISQTTATYDRSYLYLRYCFWRTECCRCLCGIYCLDRPPVTSAQPSINWCKPCQRWTPWKSCCST